MTTSFDIEHGKLLEKVSQGLDQLIGNLGHLNRNLETVNTIGNEFEAPAKLWHQFHTAVMAPDTRTSLPQESTPVIEPSTLSTSRQQ
ncbi:uncharacterized protein BX664DRAFT_338497 [Halteromyces radiatus]|uniref:uncharacterized protein n=1 Tax=Halteromyces radiatus TaxID=101107 RepID=UPI00221F33A0|nr:uncharacterized protein BX664DRAFT_338497 [Halteromyces radiatus]KAI8085088.1 hypothetical protein BX664DRAFT_338497 [Halteromyces radiatus]